MDQLKQLFESFTGEKALAVTELPLSGSNRHYYRMEGRLHTLIGTHGAVKEENISFYTLARHFYSQGLPVPQVYAHSDDFLDYLQEDLGDEILFNHVARGRDKGSYSDEETALLCKAMSKLPDLQFKGAEGLDFSVCYPQPAFDYRMVMFDLNYFKYCFLKATGLEFSELKLDDDFQTMARVLLEKSNENTFLFRDFQARNVMLVDNEPRFIDFQGGRRGPIYYDIASFVWQAKANYPRELKHKLLGAYLTAVQKYARIDIKEFNFYLRHFVLFRTLQVLGAYGFRGYFEKKPHFLQSIPYAMENLRVMLMKPYPEYPYLSRVLQELIQMRQFQEMNADKRLVIRIYSFSYKKGIPNDPSGNGGGYVFDCRAINNPGKYDRFRNLTGKDAETIKFLEDDGEILNFLDDVYKMADKHVARYIERKFTHLMFSFGCTGGQHRSVYCAEHLAEHLSRRYNVRIYLYHRELNQERTL